MLTLYALGFLFALCLVSLIVLWWLTPDISEDDFRPDGWHDERKGG